MSTDCEVRTYDNIDQNKILIITQELMSEGATIEGTNPWKADMHKGGVVLAGVWDKPTSRLQITIAEKGVGWGVPLPTCAQVWEAVEPQIQKVRAMPAKTLSPEQVAMGQIASGGSPITDADRIAFRERLNNLDAIANSQAAVATTAPEGKAEAPVASAASALSGTTKTVLYAAGGVAALTAAYFIFRKKD